MTDSTTEDMLHLFSQSTLKSVDLLFKANLYGQLLVVVYSTVDTLGLLHAPSTQVSASGPSFKTYASAYLLPGSALECSAVDLWSARCAVLHSYSSESDLTRSGTAKEIQYYTGDKSTEHARRFVELTKVVDGGRSIAVHISDLLVAFLQSLQTQAAPLIHRCGTDPLVEIRVKNVLQVYPMDLVF